LQNTLKRDDNFKPCPVDAGDELFPNGIFEFNITKIIEFIHCNPDSISLEEVKAVDLFKCFSSISESHVDSVDITNPVILAEISPGRYNVIDGNHRIEKARRMGVTVVRAYKLNVEQHIRFLTTQHAYVTYIEYWNGKLKEMGKTGDITINKRRTRR
jgi:hypothetical protein